jgi:hypothetical protein
MRFALLRASAREGGRALFRTLERKAAASGRASLSPLRFKHPKTDFSSNFQREKRPGS